MGRNRASRVSLIVGMWSWLRRRDRPGRPGGHRLERAGAGAYRPVPPAPASAAVAGEARPPAPVMDLRDALPSPYVALIELIDGRGRRMIVPQDRCDGDTVELPAVV